MDNIFEIVWKFDNEKIVMVVPAPYMLVQPAAVPRSLRELCRGALWPWQKYMGFQVGYGSGFSLGFSGNGDGHEVEYLATFPSLGVGISDLKWQNDWYRGSFDLVVEGEFIRSFEPRDGFSAGVNFLVRYNFLSWMRFVPYAEAGAGVGYLDFDLVDQEDGLIFYPQAGLGFRYFLTDRMAVNTTLRLHHISNAGTNMPNNGITSGLVLVGFTFFLD